jgi:hypothetical protein
MDSLDAAIKEVAGDAVELRLVRNTVLDAMFVSGGKEDDDFVAYHHLWAIFPAREQWDYPMSIAVAYLKEYRSTTPGKVDLAFKWVSEDNGPAAIDCPVEWLDRVPPPPELFAGDWRSMVRQRARHIASIGPRLSGAQRKLLDQLREGPVRVKGGRHATALVLVACELATMRADGSYEITERGAAELRKITN